MPGWEQEELRMSENRPRPSSSRIVLEIGSGNSRDEGEDEVRAVYPDIVRHREKTLNPN